MRWYPKTLKCQVFEDGELMDLNTCSDPVLESLADSIMDHWKTPVNSAVCFDVEIYEKHYWFKKPKNSIEIVAYVQDTNQLSGRRQIDISKLYVDKMVGRKLKITSKMRDHSSTLEVAFVA